MPPAMSHLPADPVGQCTGHQLADRPDPEVPGGQRANLRNVEAVPGVEDREDVPGEGV
jgi:hypothetical protein